MPKLLQSSFAKGEIAPSLYGRVDVAAYSIALRTARNVRIRSAGAVENRPGLQFVGSCKDHTYAPRLIPFSFKTTDSYQLEMGNTYMRVIRSGAYVTETAKNITGITAANPPVVTSNAHGFANGDEVDIAGVGGMTQLNGRRFRVNNVAANTFELQDQVTGVNINATGYSAYTSGGTASRLYKITTPFVTADLEQLKYVQSADVMTLVHRTYAPRELTRTAHTNWTLSTISFAPLIATPTGGSASSLSGSGTTYNYKVTAIASETFEESLPTAALSVSGGTTPNNRISWNTVSGAQRYAIYREVQGIYGIIGETTGLQFDDVNITPNLDISPPDARNPFNSADNYPGVVTYFEQRRVFASTNNKPDTLWFSQTGNHKNMNVSTPAQDDDAITATLNSQQVNEIRGFAPGRDLLIMTSGSEFIANSGADTALSASSLKQKPQSEWGSSHLPPLRTGNSIVYLGESNARIRSLGYSLQIDGYTGVNVGTYSPHLLEGNAQTIVDWAYSHSPEPFIYAVRSDGTLLCITFNQEQEVIAWTHSDTLGKFERVSVTRHGTSATEDDVYFIVKRRVNGQTVRYVERLHSRYFADVRDCFFVDSGLSYDNPVAITGSTAANPVVVTATAHGFSNGDTVDISNITWESNFDDDYNETQPDQLNGRRFLVNNVTANTFELQSEAGVNIDGSAYNAYVEGGYVRKCTLTVSGAWHLEGRQVVALADGNVIRGLTVANGGVTLPRKASRVHLGLQYISDIETLDIESPTGTVQGRLKNVKYVIVRFEKSRGLLIGPNSDDLIEMKQREFEAMGDPTALLTGDKRINVQSQWSYGGRIFMRQKDPLPMTILAVVPSVILGE